MLHITATFVFTSLLAFASAVPSFRPVGTEADRCIWPCTAGTPVLDNCAVRYFQDPCVANGHGHSTGQFPYPPSNPECVWPCTEGAPVFDDCNVRYIQDPCTAQGSGVSTGQFKVNGDESA